MLYNLDHLKNLLKKILFEDSIPLAVNPVALCFGKAFLLLCFLITYVVGHHLYNLEWFYTHKSDFWFKNYGASKFWQTAMADGPEGRPSGGQPGGGVRHGRQPLSSPMVIRPCRPPWPSAPVDCHCHSSLPSVGGRHAWTFVWTRGCLNASGWMSCGRDFP